MNTRILIVVTMWSILIAGARAGDTEDNTMWITQVYHNPPNYSDINGGWVVSIPPNSGDYFAVCFPVVPGIGNTGDVADGLPITGIGARSSQRMRITDPSA